MTWNYRVMKRVLSNGEVEFGIHEVYYDDDGKACSWTDKSLVPTCQSREGLKYELEVLMMRAFEEETVDFLSED